MINILMSSDREHNGGVEDEVINEEKNAAINQEASEAITVPETVTLKHFWQGMLEGKFTPLTEKEVAKIVDDIYLDKNVPRITTLSEGEATTLRDTLINGLKSYLNGGKFEFSRELIEAPVGINETKKTFITLENMEGKADNHNLRLLTQKEKIEILSNPENLSRISFRHAPNSNGIASTDASITGYGIRKLADYMPPQDFTEMVERVKHNTGHEALSALDVGGGNGRALHDMHAIYPEMKLTNLTITEEMAMFQDGIKHVLCPAEIMPASFKNSQDIILSNVAFRYFLFPDKALRCILESLSVGGEAMLGIEIPTEVMRNRESQWKTLQQTISVFEDADIIKITDDKGDENYWREYRQSGWMKITKKKKF